MSELLVHLLGLLLAGISGVICLFICLLANYKDIIWEAMRCDDENK